MARSRIYLLLAVLGAAIPYTQFVPWFLRHGFDLPLFVDQLLANQISRFFGADVLLSAIVVLTFVAFEQQRLRRVWWIPVVALFVFGVSAALPVLLHLRELPERKLR